MGRRPRHRAATAGDLPPIRRRRPWIPPGLDTASFTAWIGDGATLDANRQRRPGAPAGRDRNDGLLQADLQYLRLWSQR